MLLSRSGPGEAARIVLWIEIEDSSLRSSGIAPGPGRSGYVLARREGDAVHFLRFEASDAAERVARQLEAEGLKASAHGDQRGWVVAVWHRDESSAERWRRELKAVASANAGSYDGGEIVAEEIWGAV